MKRLPDLERKITRIHAFASVKTDAQVLQPGIDDALFVKSLLSLHSMMRDHV